MARATELGAALALAAATLAVPAAGGEFRLTPYLWAAGFTGTIGVPSSGGSVPGWEGDRLDATFAALRESLKVAGAGMLSAEWRADRLSVFGDWVYVSVESAVASSLRPLYTDVNGAIVGNVGQANAGWRAWGAGASRLDVYGGVRYYDLHVSAALTAGELAPVKRSGEDTWADGVAGMRLEQAIGGMWGLAIAGDLGAGGSAHARQGIVTFGYRTSWGAIRAGWRLLHVERTTADFRLDATLSGLLVGAAITL